MTRDQPVWLPTVCLELYCTFIFSYYPSCFHLLCHIKQDIIPKLYLTNMIIVNSMLNCIDLFGCILEINLNFIMMFFYIYIFIYVTTVCLRIQRDD